MVSPTYSLTKVELVNPFITRGDFRIQTIYELKRKSFVLVMRNPTIHSAKTNELSYGWANLRLQRYASQRDIHDIALMVLPACEYN
jgi:hypothetical protein